MSTLKRLEKLEKIELGKDGAELPVIQVKICESSEIEKDYRLFKARKKLGLIDFKEPEQIFVTGDEAMENKYANLSIEEARQIIKECENEID